MLSKGKCECGKENEQFQLHSTVLLKFLPSFTESAFSILLFSTETDSNRFLFDNLACYTAHHLIKNMHLFDNSASKTDISMFQD